MVVLVKIPQPNESQVSSKKCRKDNLIAAANYAVNREVEKKAQTNYAATH